MTVEQNVNEWAAGHSNWMANAIQSCGHHEMYTRRSTGECVSCTLESGFVSLDEALELAFPAETPTVTEYSVKIWYRSGAYEGAPHCPEDLARKIFADAVKSAGVEFAELHGPSGELLAMKGRDGLTATT